MGYQIIRPPHVLRFRDMKKRDLREYNAWFHGSIPERIEMLTAAVRSTPGFETWQSDYSPDSLDTLGAWFKAQVESRPRAPQEIQEQRDRMRINKGGLVIESPLSEEEISRTLTDRTISLAMDVGTYVSQVLLKSHPSLEWYQRTTGATFIDYGRPVLKGFFYRTVRFDPVGAMLGLAYSVLRGTETGRDLRELYEKLSKDAPPEPELA